VTSTRLTPTHLSLAGFAIFLLLAWFSYRPALSGDFQLDDAANLAGLEHVEDTATLLEFTLAGTSGPTGRPLAMLSFAMQADAWGETARPFLVANILVHLLNATLLAAFLYYLSRAQGVGRDQSALVATLTAGIWVLMPLLATASLLVVQRMTTLSATFALLGLLAYLLARSRIEQAPGRSLLWMSVSLALATGLAVFAKETGLLLPVYVLVLEATVLRRPGSVAAGRWRAWQGVILGVPAAVVFAYLAWRANYPDWTVARHGFTAWERLLSELPLLWQYLQKGLFGLPSSLGVYQVPPGIRRSLFEPAVFLSAVGWIAAAGAAIAWRRRWPVFALAVLWYLAGHIMESSVLSLELYFEHRNYLPIVGPVYAVAGAAILGSGVLRRVGLAVVPLWLVLNAFFLYQFASLSGDASASSRYWALQYPASVRAVSTMASYQLAEEGAVRALHTLDRFVAEQPHYGYLRIQELNLRCMVMPDADHDQVLDQLERLLPAVDFTFTAGRMLSQLLDTVIAGECRGVGLDTVAGLAERLRNNPRYVLLPAYNQFHHKLLAGIARQQGDLERTIIELERAIAYAASSELNMLMVVTLGSAGDFRAAHEFMASARDAGPLNPVRAIAWHRDLDNLGEYIKALERYSEDQE
jgi:hypothetical protein